LDTWASGEIDHEETELDKEKDSSAHPWLEEDEAEVEGAL